MYNNALSVSVACKITVRPKISNLSPQGITALVINAVLIAIAGPTKNRNLFLVLGSNSSLANNFIPSARGCNNPPQPARFGPTRS